MFTVIIHNQPFERLVNEVEVSVKKFHDVTEIRNSLVFCVMMQLYKCKNCRNYHSSEFLAIKHMFNDKIYFPL